VAAADCSVSVCTTLYASVRLCWKASKRAGTARKEQRMREEGIEPPTAGSGIQRSTTELFPRHQNGNATPSINIQTHSARHTTLISWSIVSHRSCPAAAHCDASSRAPGNLITPVPKYHRCEVAGNLQRRHHRVMRTNRASHRVTESSSHHW
jgi:hypothetical protein